MTSRVITRTHTSDLEQIRRNHEPVVRRYEGNSEFTRAKFDSDYDPKLRIIKDRRSHYSEQYSAKRAIGKDRLDELLFLSMKTQDEIKKGNKIVIDWGKKDNFRSTRYKKIEENGSTLRRIKTEEISMEGPLTPSKFKNSDFISNFLQSSTDKEIVSKSQRLRSLISESVANKRKKYDRASRKLTCFSTSENISTAESKVEKLAVSRIEDPHFNYSIIEEVQQKERSFFENHGDKIVKAINYEKFISGEVSEVTEKKKHKIEEIQERIICKSKLTLLKTELARKFKEIRDGLGANSPTKKVFENL